MWPPSPLRSNTESGLLYKEAFLRSKARIDFQRTCESMYLIVEGNFSAAQQLRFFYIEMFFFIRLSIVAARNWSVKMRSQSAPAPDLLSTDWIRDEQLLWKSYRASSTDAFGGHWSIAGHPQCVCKCKCECMWHGYCLTLFRLRLVSSLIRGKWKESQAWSHTQ